MGIPRPTGEYTGQMLEPGGWPESDEDTFYERAQQYNSVLRNVTDVIDATRQQRLEVFDGGVWSGGAANAANGALGANIDEMGTLQDYLVTVITWHRHIANLIEQTKSEIGNNVDSAQREIIVLENDTELEPEQRQNAINALVRATHQANTSLVAETAEQVLASKNWKPPHNALEELLHQVTPPAPEVPTLVAPTPDVPVPVGPAPTPFEPTPANPYEPIGPGVPVTPITPTPFEPTPANPYDPVGPGVPVTPVTPADPVTPVTPVPPVIPVNPNQPVTPVTPVKPYPEQPVTPVTPVAPAKPVHPTPAPGPAPTPVNPTPVHPAPSPSPTPVGPTPNQPSLPVDPSTPATPTTPSTEPAHVKPAAATDVSPGHTGQQAGPSHRGDDASPAMTPAAAGGIPAATRGSAAAAGSSSSAGAGQTAGAPAASGAGSRAAGGRAPLGGAGKAPAGATTRAAAARHAAPTRPAPPDRKDDEKDRKEPAVDVTALPSVPVSAARAARDAMAAASGAGGAKKDPLRLARRVAAALNARDSGGDDDYGFFWVTAVTTDGEIVVANSYGLAYLPDGVQLPAKVHMASADRNVPIDEKARTATYPVLAVQGWAAYHDLQLRAVIGTAEQLANSDAGVAKIILEDDDIPDSGKMVGRLRLEVVDPAAAAQLQETDDLHLLDLLPPPPADANAPDDERHMLWFDLMKPMTSTAIGREVAHLRRFHTYAAHCQDIALHAAYHAADPETQRPAVVDFLYWRYVSGLLDSALAHAQGGR